MSKDRGTVTGQIVLVGSCLQFPAKEKGQAYFQPIDSVNDTKTRPHETPITNESYNNRRPAPAVCASCVRIPECF